MTRRSRKASTVHNVATDALSQTIEKATTDPAAVRQHVSLDGEWQTQPGAAQFRATIPVPTGDPVVFEADFPGPMGGTGSAPNPLAYCFWGGLACYAMTYAQEAARRGVELRALRARVEADVMSAAPTHVARRSPAAGDVDGPRRSLLAGVLMASASPGSSTRPSFTSSSTGITSTTSRRQAGA